MWNHMPKWVAKISFKTRFQNQKRNKHGFFSYLLKWTGRFFCLIFCATFTLKSVMIKIQIFVAWSDSCGTLLVEPDGILLLCSQSVDNTNTEHPLSEVLRTRSVLDFEFLHFLEYLHIHHERACRWGPKSKHIIHLCLIHPW